MPVVWRIVGARHAGSAFDGEGARLYGGRWNSPGVPMVYTADSPSLAALEILAGLSDAAFLSKFVLISVEIPDASVTDLDARQLSKNWRTFPAPPELQVLGDAWAKSVRSLALRVPSAVIAHQRNVLLNPRHPDAATLIPGAPETFHFDERLCAKARAT